MNPASRSRGATRRKLLAASTAMLLALAGCATGGNVRAHRRTPNVLLIVADDLGYSDLGACGGEIATPNLDALAFAGLRLTDFHASPTCSPSRSMLLTGADNHTAGVGAMAETLANANRWGYEGVLTDRVATIAERLSEHGYHTMMSGKWHLGLEAAQNPHARGFASSFALLQGGHDHFGHGGFGLLQDNPLIGATYTRNGLEVSVPDDFYSSDFFATQLIEQMGAAPQDRPFFALLTFTAPHSPLQAPAALIDKYAGRYDAGWSALREQRLARMKELGLIPPDAPAHPISPDADAWDRLSADERRVASRQMEVYAAMVESLDHNVGRVVAHLRQSGRFDDTIIIFLSDNGPAEEAENFYFRLPGVESFLRDKNHSLEALGQPDSFPMRGIYWGQAASAPYRLYKGFMTEGGTRVCAFVHYSNFAHQEEIGRAFANVMDITPTLLDVAGIAPSNEVGGRSVAPIRGRSMLPYLRGERDRVHAEDEAVCFELHGQRAVRQGDWKLLRLPPAQGGSWELYNLANDPAEIVDVGSQFPERRDAMIAAWEAFAAEVRIS